MGKRSNARQRQRDGAQAAKNSVRGELLRVLAHRVDRISPTLPAPALLTAAQLAGEAGVAIEAVRELMRDCIVPDEVRMDRAAGEVVATPAGREKILSALDARMAPPAQSAPAVLKVTRIHGPRRVLAKIEGTERSVLCAMQSTVNLMPGMSLQGASEGEGGLWYYTGRSPRRKGKW
jgi:hypothetical protein